MWSDWKPNSVCSNPLCNKEILMFIKEILRNEFMQVSQRLIWILKFSILFEKASKHHLFESRIKIAEEKHHMKYFNQIRISVLRRVFKHTPFAFRITLKISISNKNLSLKFPPRRKMNAQEYWNQKKRKGNLRMKRTNF